MTIGINIAGAEFGELGGPHGGWPPVLAPDGRRLNGYIWPSAGVLAAYAADGVKLARVPFKWERMQATSMGPLVATELALLKTCLADAAKVGIRVLLDCHNYGRRDGRIATPAELADLWSKLATEIKGHPALEGYDLMNEPNNMGGPNVWLEMARAAVAAVRAIDPVGKIHVAGDGWSGAWRWHEVSTNLLPLFKQYSGLVAHAHQYLDPDGSGRYDNRVFGTTSLDIGVQRLKPFVDWCNANGVEGFVGEFGVPGQHDPKWHEAQKRMLDYMVANKIGGTYWAGGAWWGDYVIGLGAVGDETHPNFAALRPYFGAAVAQPTPVPPPPPASSAELDAAKARIVTLEGELAAVKARLAAKDALLASARTEINAGENALGRGLSRLDRAIAA